jgi:hypothetical protein
MSATKPASRAESGRPAPARPGPCGVDQVIVARPGGYRRRVDRIPLNEALRSREQVLRSFLADDGRLRSIPAKHAKRLVVLDHLAQRFEPGQRYPEAEVNRRLREAHPDVAALRRYLVEDGFLDREAGVYWRTGGSFEVE